MGTFSLLVSGRQTTAVSFLLLVLRTGVNTFEQKVMRGKKAMIPIFYIEKKSLLDVLEINFCAIKCTCFGKKKKVKKKK